VLGMIIDSLDGGPVRNGLGDACCCCCCCCMLPCACGVFGVTAVPGVPGVLAVTSGDLKVEGAIRVLDVADEEIASV